jgi:hypothetical protein
MPGLAALIAATAGILFLALWAACRAGAERRVACHTSEARHTVSATRRLPIVSQDARLDQSARVRLGR